MDLEFARGRHGAEEQASGRSIRLGSSTSLKRHDDPRDELYRLHAAAMFRRAQRLLGSETDADEVVHDVFLSVFERAEKQPPAANVLAYLYGAVTHACLNRIRNQRNRQRLREAHTHVIQASEVAGTVSEWSLTARTVLAQLPDDLACVAVYYHLDELSHREIAEIMGCSRRHVGNLLVRLARWAEVREKSLCEH
jgi:RNA polymerase sigma-70 factor (ECF subfamily)